MKRFFLALLLIVFAVSSCGKNGWYINVDNTAWEISTDTQVGWPCFLDDEHVSIVQVNQSSGYMQTLNGTFTVKGHRVDVTADGTSLYMIRTFSHLKNSSNKNYRSLSPEVPQELAGSVWAYMKDTDLHFFYFRENATYLSGVYSNVAHREGIDEGWKTFTTVPYELAGSQFSSVEAGKGSFFKSFLRLDSAAVPLVSRPGSLDGSSSLEGTLWSYTPSTLPGDYVAILIFTSARDFTRIVVGSEVIFGTLTGTYEVKENSVSFTTEAAELCEDCPIEDGQFTYLKKTYSLLSL